MSTNKKDMKQSDIIYNKLNDEGIVGIVWCIMSDIPFDEDKFESFKYGFQLSDNEEALKDKLPHKHNLIDKYIQMENRFNNDFVELGRKAYEMYGAATEVMCAPHCSTCMSYVVINGPYMFCSYLNRRITARKKPCSKYTSFYIQNYINTFYNGNDKED